MSWKEKLSKMIDTKTAVTMGVLAVYMVLALRGKIMPDNVTNTFNMVIAFYFGTQSEKRKAI